MGNKCIGEVDIFAAKDGIYVSDPSCYVVGSDVVKYSKKSTTIDGVTTVTYIDEAGVETASLPVGTEQIDCSKVVFVGNSGSTIPVTDSWFLLYDTVEDVNETTTPLIAWSITGGVTSFGDQLLVSSDGTATTTVTLPKPATLKSVGLWLGIDPSNVSMYINGEVVPNIMNASFYTDPDGEATIEFVFSGIAGIPVIAGIAGQVTNLMIYNNDGSIGSCKPFIRRIVDNVVTDTELDLTTPYTAVGEVRTSCSDAQKEPTCTCTDELQALQASVDSIAALFAQKYVTPTYSYQTAAYMVSSPYKSLTVAFINEGTINGQYVPEGYSFSHPREIDATYQSSVNLGGTGFAVWEER